MSNDGYGSVGAHVLRDEVRSLSCTLRDTKSQAHQASGAIAYLARREGTYSSDPGCSPTFVTALHAEGGDDSAAAAADENDVIARRIVVTGDVDGGYYRSCIKNEVRFPHYFVERPALPFRVPLPSLAPRF